MNNTTFALMQQLAGSVNKYLGLSCRVWLEVRPNRDVDIMMGIGPSHINLSYPSPFDFSKQTNFDNINYRLSIAIFLVENKLGLVSSIQDLFGNFWDEPERILES